MPAPSIWTTTNVAAGGKLTRVVSRPNPNAPIDYFYVYPTASQDPDGNGPFDSVRQRRTISRNLSEQPSLVF
jgi:hypothetical protein